MTAPLSMTEATAMFVEAAVIRPGDTLILRYHRDVQVAHIAKMKDRVKEALPAVDLLVVVADGMLVYRPEDRP